MRASHRWFSVVLVVLLGLLGPPAVAAASDDGLREVVKRDVAVSNRLNAAEKRLRAPSSKSFPAYIRFLRRVTNHYARIERSVDGLRRSYRAQTPQTSDAARGRTLVLRAHGDLSAAAHGTVVAFRRGIRGMTNARSERTYRTAYRRMIRGLNAQNPRFRRGNSRRDRGQKLIRRAPAPPASPTVPGPVTPPGPTGAIPTPSTPAPSPTPTPAPLLPGLPLVSGLLGG
ncbi:hypothetical protein [Patulibacter minatonensis]|uniref:hypothetical protein n=1 Tax=Patulibacter minatonensis TaxID=298163 RepID=UPI00047A52B1|nr:hypothetical protein [Patulibacter minatonensis]